jgi:sugar-phosphatase
MHEIHCRAILFDLDGVLVDSTVIVERHWHLWAERHGLAVESILAHSHGRRTIDTLQIVAAHLPLDLEQEAALLEKYESEDVEGLVPVPGAVELIRSLPDHTWAVVTSGSYRLASPRLQAVGVPIPDVFITAEEVQQGKPHPEGYLMAARRLGQAPQDCLVIEDAPAGIRAARAAGCRVIGVTTTFSAAEVAEADVIVPDLSSISLAGTADNIPQAPRLTLHIM